MEYENFNTAYTHIPSIIVIDSNKFLFLLFTKLALTRGYLSNYEYMHCYSAEL